MATTTVSLEIPDELLAQVQATAERYKVKSEAILLSAVEHYLEVDMETRLAVEEGLRQLDAGESFSHEEVMASYHARIFADKAA
jgi:predicted transcriptional regulator